MWCTEGKGDEDFGFIILNVPRRRPAIDGDLRHLHLLADGPAEQP